MQDLYDILGETGTGEGEGETFGCERCLRRWFEEDGVACNDGREDRIYGDEVGVTSKVSTMVS